MATFLATSNIWLMSYNRTYTKHFYRGTSDWPICGSRALKPATQPVDGRHQTGRYKTRTCKRCRSLFKC